jgi:hypothetical protein
MELAYKRRPDKLRSSPDFFHCLEGAPSASLSLVTDAATDAPIRVIPAIGKRRQEHQVLLLEVQWWASVGIDELGSSSLDT